MSGLLTECLLSCQLDSIRFVTLLIWYIARRSNSTDSIVELPVLIHLCQHFPSYSPYYSPYDIIL